MYSDFSPWDRAAYVRHVLGDASLKLRNYANVDRLISTAGASFEWLIAACYYVAYVIKGSPDERLSKIMEIGPSPAVIDMAIENILFQLDAETLSLVFFHPLVQSGSPKPRGYRHIWELHKMLAQLCFQIMKRRLCFNICDIRSSYFSNEDIKYLPTRVQDRITSSLRYACAKWTTHLSFVLDDDEVVEEAKEFISTRCLQWLEVMSFTGMEFTSGLNRLMKLIVGNTHVGDESSLTDLVVFIHSPLKVLKPRSDLQVLVADVHRFATVFEAPIRHCVPHIYVSALSFAPPHCHVRRNADYSTGIPLRSPPRTSISPRSDLHSRDHYSWEAINARTSNNNRLRSVRTVAFSEDGKHFVTASDKSAIDVWDAVTYEHTRMFSPSVSGKNYAAVSVVAISPDSGCVIAGYELGVHHTVRMWKISSGSELGIGRPDLIKRPRVMCLAFNTDGTSLAAGLGSGGIIIWDPSNDSLVLKMVISDPYVSGGVIALSYSSDSSKLACATEHGKFDVWNMTSGYPSSYSHHSDSGYSVIHCAKLRPHSTADDFDVVFGTSGGETVHRRSLRDNFTHSLTIKENPCALAFSSDGKCFITGLANGNIAVRDVSTGSMIGAPMRGHKGSVESIAFSANRKQVVSGSRDEKICVWDLEKIEAIVENQVRILCRAVADIRPSN